MKRFLSLVFLFILLSPVSLFAQDKVIQYNLGVAETILSNNLLWGFNRYIHQSDYGMISMNSIQSNLSSTWVWDQDEFIVNHWGHPYQGAVYFSAGRSSGNGFWRSASLTVLGSVSWELLMETETPSKNDLIITTFGGITLGEMLYRLSEVVRYGSDGSIEEMGLIRRFGSTLMSPYTGINKYYLKNYTRRISPIKGYHWIGAGMSRFTVDYIPQTASLYESTGIDLNYNIKLDYGDPYSSRNDDPFDFFSLSGGALISYDNEKYFSFFSEGQLFGRAFYGKSEWKQNLGLYLNYDFFYNRIVNLGANGIGLGWHFDTPIGEKWHFNSALYLNYIFLGASDIVFLKYNDIWLSPPDYERRSYSLSQGEGLKMELSFNRKDSFFMDLNYNIYGLFIIDSSVPEGGEKGAELAGVGSVSIRQMVAEDFFVGVIAYIYHKESYYEHYKTINERIWSYSLFYGFRF